jgi:proline iminopeptidase
MREQFEIVFCDSRQWVRTPDSFDISTITFDTFCDDVEAVRQATGLDRPVVVGHSQHGAIALEYARRYRACVRGVVAVAAVPPFGSEVGLGPADDFSGRDASPQRLAAHERNRAERRGPATVQTPQDFVDDYVSRDAMNWYDYNFNCSPRLPLDARGWMHCCSSGRSPMTQRTRSPTSTCWSRPATVTSRRPGPTAPAYT